MSTKSTSRSELFLRGAQSYLEALTAIEVFRQGVEKICNEVYQRYEAELAARMGLDAAEWERYDESDLGERWAELGVKRRAQPGCWFYLCLEWYDADSGDNEIAATVWLDVYHKNLRDKIYNSFHQENQLCPVEKYGTYQLYSETPLKPNELGSAGEVLDKLVSEWLGYCKSVGGLNLKKFKTS